MLDVKESVVSALKTIGIEVQYEMFHKTTNAPCITYIEYMNKDNLTGDDFGYSEIGYTITVWAKTPQTMMSYAQAVDTKMRNLGFKRTTSNEMVQNNIYRKVLDYKGLGIENY